MVGACWSTVVKYFTLDTKIYSEKKYLRGFIGEIFVNCGV